MHEFALVRVCVYVSRNGLVDKRQLKGQRTELPAPWLLPIDLALQFGKHIQANGHTSLIGKLCVKYCHFIGTWHIVGAQQGAV